MTSETFYDADKVAIVPMGFCYPGTGKQGDLPPRPECAPQWHPRLLPLMKRVQLTIYLGRYAWERHLGNEYAGLTEAAADFGKLLPTRIVLPHPSPRNQMWVKRNGWFESDLLPALRESVRQALA
jgi:uracil-DNA glycosylase